MGHVLPGTGRSLLPLFFVLHPLLGCCCDSLTSTGSAQRGEQMRIFFCLIFLFPVAVTQAQIVS